MGKVVIIILAEILILTTAFVVAGCSTLHVVYKRKEVRVVDGETGQICNKAYSEWNGKTWTDYFVSPCNVKVEDVE